MNRVFWMLENSSFLHNWILWILLCFLFGKADNKLSSWLIPFPIQQLALSSLRDEPQTRGFPSIMYLSFSFVTLYSSQSDGSRSQNSSFKAATCCKLYPLSHIWTVILLTTVAFPKKIIISTVGVNDLQNKNYLQGIIYLKVAHDICLQLIKLRLPFACWDLITLALFLKSCTMHHTKHLTFSTDHRHPKTIISGCHVQRQRRRKLYSTACHKHFHHCSRFHQYP